MEESTIVVNEKEEVLENQNPQKLNILVTDEDKYGTDISMMSNFFDLYIQELQNRLDQSDVIEYVEEIPFGDIGIAGDIINYAGVIIKGEYSYIPDFDSLPAEIKTKFNQGIYTLGESRQVDGNMRAVILDENKQRIKDVTLKKVQNSFGTMETIRSISNQVQMRQIYAKLDSIEAMQEYQIARDRDRDIRTPFIAARQYILRAQEAETREEQNKFLDKAYDKLNDAVSGVYTDMDTTSAHLAKLTARPFFRHTKQIRMCMEYLREDLQVSTKFIGVQMRIADYQGNRKAANSILENHKFTLQNFIDKSIGSKGYTAAMLMQMNYPYNESNRDYWYNFSNDIKPLLEAAN